MAHDAVSTASGRSLTDVSSATLPSGRRQPSTTSVSPGHTGLRNCPSSRFSFEASPPQAAATTALAAKPKVHSPCKMGPCANPTAAANAGSAWSGFRSPESR
jgi:hypothetical protein